MHRRRRRLHSTLCLHFFLALSLFREGTVTVISLSPPQPLSTLLPISPPILITIVKMISKPRERGRNQSGCLSRSSLLDRSVNERRTCTSCDSHETVRCSRPRPPPSLKGQKYCFSINFKCFKVHPPELSSDRSSEIRMQFLVSFPSYPQHEPGVRDLLYSPAR